MKNKSMESLLPTPSSYCQSFKRYWRRRKYQRLNGTRYGCIPKRLKITRLGGMGSPCLSRCRCYSQMRTTPKLGLKVLSPIKLLAKLHGAYTEMMIRLAVSMDWSVSSVAIGGNKVKKGQQVSLVSTGEEVDSRQVMEIYKKFAASRGSEEKPQDSYFF